MKIHDLRIAGGPIGLVLLNVTRHVDVVGLRVAATTIGMQIERSDCGRCRIRLLGADFEGVAVAGVRSQGFEGTLHLSTVRIEALGGGHRTQVNDGNQRAQMTSNGSVGVDVRHAAQLVVRHVSVVARVQSVGSGVFVEDVADVQVENLTVADFEAGVEVHGGRATLSSIHAEGGTHGILVEDATLSVQRLRVERCAGAGVRLFAASFDGHDVEVTRCRSGIHASAVPELRLRHFRLVGNDYGLRTDSDNLEQSVLVLADGVVDRNRFAGLELRWDQTNAANIRVEGNGFDAPDPERPGALENEFGGVVVRRSVRRAVAIVTGSSFLDNSPYALSTSPESVADAPGNWWGTATGPRVRPADAGGLARFDNSVTPGVVFVPFRTTP